VVRSWVACDKVSVELLGGGREEEPETLRHHCALVVHRVSLCLCLHVCACL
jgi:hypothetical protein